MIRWYPDSVACCARGRAHSGHLLWQLLTRCDLLHNVPGRRETKRSCHETRRSVTRFAIEAQCGALLSFRANGAILLGIQHRLR